MFWNNIIKLCAAKGISPTAFVSDLGVSRGSVTHWKNGKIPHETTLQKIADYFGVTVDYLLNGENETPSDAKSTEERDKNIVRVIGRDGTYTERTLTDEQLKALQMIIDQMPDAPDDL